MPNPIVLEFREKVDPVKELQAISPEKQSSRPRKVKLIYKDGSEEMFTVDLAHNDFMKNWREFSCWFNAFRNTKLDP
ncbi:MAG: hypothetical protein SFY80_05995 [Verrucomicrobiota bacterium]|nr:hypothetical protein [Verrucomicrobiota bacterium]